MAIPRLNLTDFTVHDRVDHAQIIDRRTQREYRLESQDALFLRCIDGQKTVAQIRDEISDLLHFEVPSELLWTAFDRLSDIGLLEARLAPPGSSQVSSRRGFLKSFSLAAGTGSLALPAVAFADQEQDQKIAAEESNKLQAAEQTQKQQTEQDAKTYTEQNTKTQAALSNKESVVKQNGGGGVVSVPEPASLTLLGLGIAMAAIVRRRVQRQAEAQDQDNSAD